METNQEANPKRAMKSTADASSEAESLFSHLQQQRPLMLVAMQQALQADHTIDGFIQELAALKSTHAQAETYWPLFTSTTLNAGCVNMFN